LHIYYILYASYMQLFAFRCVCHDRLTWIIGDCKVWRALSVFRWNNPNQMHPHGYFVHLQRGTEQRADESAIQSRALRLCYGNVNIVFLHCVSIFLAFFYTSQFATQCRANQAIWRLMEPTIRQTLLWICCPIGEVYHGEHFLIQAKTNRVEITSKSAIAKW
jgi:hypothetical protein